MERRRQLDTARHSPGHSLIPRAAVFLWFVSCALHASAQVPIQDENLLVQIKQLSAQEHWQEIVHLVEASPQHSAELDYYHGIALARLARWREARLAFQAGSRLQPKDKRFPLELAGIAFKQKNYHEAVSYLHRALKLDPADPYGNEFLASVYFIQGNLQAALKYWNRVGKPRIQELRMQPKPRLNAVVLDRALAFSPAATLRLPDLLTTEVRITGLDIFPSYHFDLAAREDERFDIIFRSQGRNGWGNNTLQGLIGLFRGIPYQTVTPEFFNIGASGINFVSLVRWDPDKRRLLASVAGPLHGDPKRRYRIGVDLRNENWDVRDSISRPVTFLGALNLRREATEAEFTSFNSGRWQWSTGAELSHRDSRSVVPGVALSAELLSEGYELKHLASLNYQLWRVPERRLTVDAQAASQIARIWSQPAHAFAKLQGSVGARWLPLAGSDDYETHSQVRTGKTYGDVPFDELFMLGVERDNDLWLRGHVGTHDGRKGNAPLGRNYFLSNTELDKNIYQNGLFNFKLGPLLDIGKITDPFPSLRSRKWQWDIGVQAKVRVLGVGVSFSYGRDLRSGKDVFYTAVGR
jgi:tetratricopeptide (TPR) repeat protein